MADLLNELLKNSMEREAKRLASNGGVTERDRYGTLLDSVKGRNLEKEESDKRQEILSHIHSNAEESRMQREKEFAESKRNLQRIVNDVVNRERREANEFIARKKVIWIRRKSLYRGNRTRRILGD
ncbi:MAG: hypothetical protein HDR08_11080 [Lachnospiraceae bacterium]|nr:hypothetical protein [Lachnospiraceae bacterium]